MVVIAEVTIYVLTEVRHFDDPLCLPLRSSRQGAVPPRRAPDSGSSDLSDPDFPDPDKRTPAPKSAGKKGGGKKSLAVVGHFNGFRLKYLKLLLRKTSKNVLWRYLTSYIENGS